MTAPASASTPWAQDFDQYTSHWPKPIPKKVKKGETPPVETKYCVHVGEKAAKIQEGLKKLFEDINFVQAESTKELTPFGQMTVHEAWPVLDRNVRNLKGMLDKLVDLLLLRDTTRSHYWGSGMVFSKAGFASLVGSGTRISEETFEKNFESWKEHPEEYYTLREKVLFECFKVRILLRMLRNEIPTLGDPETHDKLDRAIDAKKEEIPEGFSANEFLKLDPESPAFTEKLAKITDLAVKLMNQNVEEENKKADESLKDRVTPPSLWRRVFWPVVTITLIFVAAIGLARRVL